MAAAGIACGAWQLDKLTPLPISDQSFDLLKAVGMAPQF